MNTLKDIKPGDTVVLFDYRGGRSEVKVARVGRKYIHLDEARRSGGFHIASGHEATDPSHRRIQTHEQVEHADERAVLMKEVERRTSRVMTYEPFIRDLTNEGLRDFLTFIYEH